jgi:GT2 family glycosyltransferase
LRLLLRQPQERVRLSHVLTNDDFRSGTKLVAIRVRGLPEAGKAVQLDFLALSDNIDSAGKSDQRLLDATLLEWEWRKFTARLPAGHASVDGPPYVSLQFSGKGTIEVEFCRIEDGTVNTDVLSSARNLAKRVLAGIRRTTPTAADDGLIDERLIADPPRIFGTAGESHVVEVDLGPLPESAPETGTANVLRNPRFGAWQGNHPDSWTVSVSDGASIESGVTSEDQPFKSPLLSILFDKSEANQSALLAQRVSGLSSKQFVDVVVVGRAEARTELEVLLTNHAGQVVPGSRATLTLWPAWHFRSARMSLPSKLTGDQHGFAMIVRGAQSQIVSLAFVAASEAGQRLGVDFEVCKGASLDCNAVVNGRIDYWQGPLSLPLVTPRLKILDEWTLTGMSASPTMTARLGEISLRRSRDGQDRGSLLGIALEGEIVGPHLRMEASLDPLCLAASPPQRVLFYARGARRTTTIAEGQPSIIHQIFVSECRRNSPGGKEFHVRRLFTIKRNISIEREGEMYSLPLRRDHQAIIAAKAKEFMLEPGHSLILVFEFAGIVDIAIGDVHLGGSAMAELLAPTENVTAMEDPNIVAQLPLLKGMTAWQSRTPVQAGRLHETAIPISTPTWEWLPGLRLTTDIVICVHNAIVETLDCLESIYRHTTMPHTVTIVEDGSSELTREQLRSYVNGKPWVRLIENEKNLGYTRSANIALRSSKAEWIVLLNSDTIVTPGWLEDMFEVVRRQPDVAMVGPLSNAASWQSVPDLHDVRGRWSVNPLPPGVSANDVARLVNEHSCRAFPEATLLNGFCMLMRRSAIEEVGYFDETAFPMGYGEENDLCLRLRKAGHSLIVADHVYVFHVKTASFTSARRQELVVRGIKQLSIKHPDVDIKEAQRAMAELTPLTELRKTLRRILQSEPNRVEAVPGASWNT